MLILLNLAQLVLYIALLAFVGQAVLHVLAGPARDANVFYRLLQLVVSPFTRMLRRLTPGTVGDGRVAWLSFVVVVVLYAVVTVARAHWCLSGGLLGQAGCR